MTKTYNSQSVVRVRGRAYTLFRRTEKGTSPFNIRIQVGNRRRNISTGTTDITLAKARAKQIIIKSLDGGWEEEDQVKALKKGIPTIGECVDLFLNGDQHVRSVTARDYVSSFYLVVREVKEWDKEKADKQKIDQLTDTVVRDFQAKRQKRDNVTFVEPLKVNTTINSNIRQARAVFSRRAIATYEKAGMTMPPTLRSFLKAPLLKEVSHRYSDNPIPQKQIDSMNKALPKIKKKDERLWAIHIMIRLMGMRDKEIQNAKKDWIIERKGRSYLVINRRDGEEAPKRGDGEIPIPDILMEWIESRQGEYIIEARTKTARYNLIYRDHNKFVRKHIKNRQKGNHELRKWSGSVIAQKTNSWERAAQFLRIDIETAKAHYLAFTEPTEPLTIEDL